MIAVAPKWWHPIASMSVGSLTLSRLRTADALCQEWNVFAVDLQNEPYLSSWGSGNPSTDWSIGAQVLGDHVLSKCPRWLIMVEGVSDKPGVTGANNRGHFWGENMEVHSLTPCPSPTYLNKGYSGGARGEIGGAA